MRSHCIHFLDSMSTTATRKHPGTYVTIQKRMFRVTYPSETNQVLELSPVYKILTINATFDCKFFSFCKQTVVLFHFRTPTFVYLFLGTFFAQNRIRTRNL